MENRGVGFCYLILCLCVYNAFRNVTNFEHKLTSPSCAVPVGFVNVKELTRCIRFNGVLLDTQKELWFKYESELLFKRLKIARIFCLKSVTA